MNTNTHEIYIVEPWFTSILLQKKTSHIAPNFPSIKKIKIGDTIIFKTNVSPTFIRSLEVKVNYKMIYVSYKKCINDVGIECLFPGFTGLEELAIKYYCEDGTTGKMEQEYNVLYLQFNP